MEVSKKSPARIVNTKAYYISRKASWFTAKTSRAAIADSLGSRAGGGRLKLRPGTDTDAPLAALIVQSRRAAKGQKGLYGIEMATAINQLISSRLKSIAFLRSGWLPAIRLLAPLADRGGAPPMDTAARQF